MNIQTQPGGLAARTPDERLGGIIKLAVMAVGGQGGGVLTNWIEALARGNGYDCQATSVAGVAQRTGATIYYVEMAPKSGGTPIFSLAPSGGDIDVLIAAEMMEAGRAIMRGFVTPDRTTLIASTHRMLAVSEKMVPGDGIADPNEVRAAAEIAARKLIMADLDTLATQQGSVISASLFGALAGSGALPFPREAYEAAIRASGKGVEASLRAFGVGYETAQRGVEPAAAAVAKPAAAAPLVTGPQALIADWEALCRRIQALPEVVQDIALAGLRKVVDFQDLAYGTEYLDRVAAVHKRDGPAHDHQLTREAAKYIANAMAYDDVIRVADLKTRSTRMARIRQQMNAGEVMQLTEYLHPRAPEIVSLFPARLGEWFERSEKRMARFDRLVNKGRRLRTDGLRGFLQLYVIASLKGRRRGNLRHKTEMAHMTRWLDTALGRVNDDYALAVETLRCRRLVKGYSDTHARGLSKFDRVMAAIALVEGRQDAADWARRLREAALADEEGKALDGAVQTIRSFLDTPDQAAG
ncbi:MAG: indolepyruvate oxidoreductase subunit beta family protein [Pararhodobacter sp.]|nr:indolepyruvate oxidoreductase subunit beta family protein [Pararhodobacter sp.]